MGPVPTSTATFQVEASPYAKDTVSLITEDEGGGYYDSGYVQPVDFFGDGLKFIERNWRLPAVTRRSRDNFPNPVQLPGSYAPVNTPALDDLFDFFDFSSPASGSGAHVVMRGPPIYIGRPSSSDR